MTVLGGHFSSACRSRGALSSITSCAQHCPFTLGTRSLRFVCPCQVLPWEWLQQVCWRLFYPCSTAEPFLFFYRWESKEQPPLGWSESNLGSLPLSRQHCRAGRTPLHRGAGGLRRGDVSEEQTRARRDAVGRFTGSMWVPVGSALRNAAAQLAEMASGGGQGQRSGPALCPSTLSTRADEQLLSSRYLPAPRAAPAPWQVHALLFLPFSCDPLSLLAPPKLLAGFYPLQQRVPSPPPLHTWCTQGPVWGETCGASKNLGHAWGVWRACCM